MFSDEECNNPVENVIIPVDKNAHKFETYVANGDATCQKNETETANCKYGCGETDTREIADSKVDHAYENYVGNNDATCQKNETETGTCKYGCGETDTREIADSKVDHIPGEAVEENRIEPSCGEDGSYDLVTYCSVCGEFISKVTKIITSTGEHNFVADESTRVDATCVAVGYVIKKCGCGKEIKEIIPVNVDAHDFSEIGDAPVSGEEPNCIKEGISRHYCLNEGCTVYRKEILPKTEHKYDDVTVVSATCVNNGYIRYACSEAECDASYDEYYKTNANGDKVLLYPMIDHDYRYVNVAPTCEKDGYTNCICNICNYSYVDANSFVPAKGHADKDGDGVCDTCKLDAVFGSCTCLCHSKNWFIRIIYIIVRFIWKLLKISPVCNCGVAHY